MVFEWIFSIPDVLYTLGVRNAIISPGSRSAPLTLAFARNKKIRKFIIPDERSAGYFALGTALQTQAPVVLICTSGTAVVNLYPAIIEAFYQKVPLIILTADRPPECIDQGDGQTICQDNIFENHVKKSITMAVPDQEGGSDWSSGQKIANACKMAFELPKGPVHINLPFREPLYPKIEHIKSIPFDQKTEDVYKQDNVSIDWDALTDQLKTINRVLFILGQHPRNLEFTNDLKGFASKYQIPVISEVISNFTASDQRITTHDLFLSGDHIQHTDLIPGLIISFGNAILSKNLKLFLRKHTSNHWHVSEDGQAVNVFQKLSNVIQTPPCDFLREIGKRFPQPGLVQKEFFKSWIEAENKTCNTIKTFFSKNEFSELSAITYLLTSIPTGSTVHLANSMPVRWVNYFQFFGNKLEYFSNRGTSGIDGCLSTAVGITIHRKNLNFLITGDMAFFYDRNGLWHSYIPPNLRIVVLNNHGGGIFRLIDGPSSQPELEEYFITNQSLSVKNSAKDFELEYLYCNDTKSLHETSLQFIRDDGKAKILEIETDSVVNKRIFNTLKSKIKEIWN